MNILMYKYAIKMYNYTITGVKVKTFTANKNRVRKNFHASGWREQKLQIQQII